MQDAKDQRPIGAPLGASINLNLRKFFTDYFQTLAQRFFGIQEYFNDVVLKQEWPSGPPGVPKVLKIQKFFIDCLQNLAQCFIGIQESFNDIVLKQEWPSGP